MADAAWPGGLHDMLKRWFHRHVLPSRWRTFLAMGLAFFVFGAGTLNIFMLFSANAEYVADYGWAALMEGAARQFVELVVTGYLSMAGYVVFKTCEQQLVRALVTEEPGSGASTTTPVDRA